MAYAETTKVSFDRSISEIIGMVRKRGAQQIAQMEELHYFALQFTMDNRMIRFRVPFPLIDDMPNRDGRGRAIPETQRVAKLEQARRQKGRALMLVIKAKLESVESGVETLEQAFLANVVMSDGATVYERIGTGIELEYKTGQISAVSGLLPPPEPAANK